MGSRGKYGANRRQSSFAPSLGYPALNFACPLDEAAVSINCGLIFCVFFFMIIDIQMLFALPAGKNTGNRFLNIQMTAI